MNACDVKADLFLKDKKKITKFVNCHGLYLVIAAKQLYGAVFMAQMLFFVDD